MATYCWIPKYYILVGGFSPTPLKNMLVKLDHLPRYLNLSFPPFPKVPPWSSFSDPSGGSGTSKGSSLGPSGARGTKGSGGAPLGRWRIFGWEVLRKMEESCRLYNYVQCFCIYVQCTAIYSFSESRCDHVWFETAWDKCLEDLGIVLRHLRISLDISYHCPRWGVQSYQHQLRKGQR